MAKKEKMCPLLNETCLENDCALFNEKFGRCDIGLLAFNLYRFSEAITRLEGMMPPPDQDKVAHTFEGGHGDRSRLLKDTLRL